MENIDPREVYNVNGEPTSSIMVIGPVTSGNGCDWWLVRAARQDNRLISPMGSDLEFAVCQAPFTKEWGWLIDSETPFVHYAFADGVRNEINKVKNASN